MHALFCQFSRKSHAVDEYITYHIKERNLFYYNFDMTEMLTPACLLHVRTTCSQINVSAAKLKHTSLSNSMDSALHATWHCCTQDWKEFCSQSELMYCCKIICRERTSAITSSFTKRGEGWEGDCLLFKLMQGKKEMVNKCGIKKSRF